MEKTGPKKASSACTACQLRKSRCTGGVPCDKCQIRKTECVVDQNNDGRRKIALKRKQQEWEGDKALLEDVFQILRVGDESQIQQLVRTVRESVSWDDISGAVNDQMTVISGGRGRRISASTRKSEELPSDQVISDDDNARHLMSMNRLIDDPLYKVPASPWTTVTSDNHLTSHLISLWFTWVSPSLSWIDRTLFLRDMQLQKTKDATYCSPFLVNAMLADACPYSDYAAVKTHQCKASRMMQQFLSEAKRHLDEEAGRASLATLQGLGIMYNCVCALGLDRQGYIYARQIADMATELVRTNPRYELDQADVISETSNSLQQACWALWIGTTQGCLLWQRSPVMHPPACKKPVFASHETAADQWTPYPVTSTKVPAVSAHSACLFEINFELAAVVTDCLTFLFSPEYKSAVPDESRAFSDAYDRLVKWYGTFPECLALRTSSPFHILLPHLYYHYLIVVLSSFSDGSRTTSSQELVHPHTRPRDQLTSLCVRSALEIAHMLESYRSTWGSGRCPSLAVHWAVGALFALLNMNVDSPECRRAFVNLCEFVRSSSQRWPLSRGLLRMIQITTYQKTGSASSSPLPPELIQLFQDFQSHIWRTGVPPGQAVDVLGEFSSFYPNMTEAVKRYHMQRQQSPATITDKPPIVDMDKFLQQYEFSQ